MTQQESYDLLREACKEIKLCLLQGMVDMDSTYKWNPVAVNFSKYEDGDLYVLTAYSEDKPNQYWYISPTEEAKAMYDTVVSGDAGATFVMITHDVGTEKESSKLSCDMHEYDKEFTATRDGKYEKYIEVVSCAILIRKVLTDYLIYKNLTSIEEIKQYINEHMTKKEQQECLKNETTKDSYVVDLISRYKWKH